MKILVSACLLGENCKYDGGNNLTPWIVELGKSHTLIPFCPECYGGLPTPRVPAERQGEKVVNQNGEDVTDAYQKGAEEARRIAVECGCEAAILKARSPSCGCGEIYDGTFSHKVIPGDGVTAEWLKKSGIRIYTEHAEEAWS